MCFVRDGIDGDKPIHLFPKPNLKKNRGMFKTKCWTCIAHRTTKLSSSSDVTIVVLCVLILVAIYICLYRHDGHTPFVSIGY